MCLLGPAASKPTRNTFFVVYEDTRLRCTGTSSSVNFISSDSSLSDDSFMDFLPGVSVCCLRILVLSVAIKLSSLLVICGSLVSLLEDWLRMSLSSLEFIIYSF